MAGSLLPEPKQQFLNDIGAPLFAGKIYTYAAGTLTPKTTYQDQALSIANTNPVIANARGEVVMYGEGNYRVILKDALDVTIWDRDNIETTGYSLIASLATFIASLASTIGSSLIGFIQAGAGAVARTMQSKARDIVSIRDFGAVGDGVVDDTAATQNFINYCIGTSRAGYVPTPSNAYRLTAKITVTGSLNITGDGVCPYKSPAAASHSTRGLGSWFYIDHNGIGFDLNNTSETTHVTFDGIGTYRNHPDPAPGWAPTVSDYDFKCSQPNGDYSFKNMVLLNPYRGLFLNGRCTIEDLRGQPLFIGIWGNLCGDTTRFTKVHFWPYWSTNDAVKAYTLANSIGFWLNRLDNPSMQDCFTLWMFAAIRISQSVDGTTAKFRIVNCDFDATNYGIYVDSSVTVGMSMQISNLSTQCEAGIANGIALFVEGSAVHINISNMTAAQCIQNAIRITGGGNRIGISNFRPINWNLINTAFPAIEAVASNFIRMESQMDYVGGNGAALMGGAGKFIVHAGGNIAAGTTDATGRLVVVHNLRITPGRIICQLSGPDTGLVVRVDAITSTNFAVRCYLNNVAYTSGSIAFYWEAFDVN